MSFTCEQHEQFKRDVIAAKASDVQQTMPPCVASVVTTAERRLDLMLRRWFRELDEEEERLKREHAGWTEQEPQALANVRRIKQTIAKEIFK